MTSPAPIPLQSQCGVPPLCKVCYAVAYGKRQHTGVLADADSIPVRTTSPHLSLFVLVISYSSVVPPLCAPIDIATLTLCYPSFPSFLVSDLFAIAPVMHLTTAMHSASPLSSSLTSVDMVSPSMRAPLRGYRWISYASGLLEFLLFPFSSIIDFLLLAFTTPYFSAFLTRPVLLRISYSLSSTPPCPFSHHTHSLPVLWLERLLTLRFDDLGQPLVDS